MICHKPQHPPRRPLSRPAAARLRMALIATVLVLVTLSGCSNSILRNAAEAGYETLTDAPDATPTPARQ